jgi:hypothetical protein
VQVLHHHHERCLLPQTANQAEQQLEQARLRGLVGRPGGVGLAEAGEQASYLRPGWADHSADLFHADLGDQGPQSLHDRRIGQGTVAHGQAAADQHPGPVAGATGDQLGDEACLADTGLAPHQDDSRLGGCRPPPGRLEDPELPDAADEDRACHATAHLAEIIPRARPEWNGGRIGQRPKIWIQAALNVWHLPDSGGTSPGPS